MMPETVHLDPDLVAAYLDGDLADEHRVSVESHLADCIECCREVAALDDTLRTMPRAGSLRRYAMPAAAVAAILAVVLIARPWLEEPTTPGVEPLSIERAAPDIASPHIEAVSPAHGGLVDRDSVVLAWRSAGGGARYQVTITTAAGDSVWATMIADTEAAIPADALDPHREYLWYVDALLPDGRTSSTGISHFRTAP